MAGIDGVFATVFSILEIHHRHHLAFHVVRVFCCNLSFLHQLQQRGLNTPTTDITPHGISSTACQLINFIDVNDSIFSEIKVAISFLHQLSHQVIHITADVSGFRKFGGIRFDKWHSDHFGNVFHQIGFTHTCRADNNHVLFLVLNPIGDFAVLLFESTHVFGMIIMITNSNRKCLFGLILPDHKSIKMCLNVTRFVIKIKNSISLVKLHNLGLILLGVTSIPLLVKPRKWHRHTATHLTKHTLQHFL